MPEYFGDMAVVNGVTWPKVKVEARPYRFRLLDGSNARCYELSMKSATLLNVPRWNIIGSDQGYLPAPVTTKTITMCPGERYDAVVDFSGVPTGTLITVSNSASAPFPNGIKNTANGPFALMGEIMQFVVVPTTNGPAPAPWVKPLALVPRTNLVATPTAPKRQMVLNEVLDPVTLAPLRVQIDGKRFEDAVTETPTRGTVEQWTIVNTTVDAHPMHLHLVQFQVVSRQAFDLKGFTAALGPTDAAINPQNYNLAASVTPFLKGKPRAPEPGESGWKDTARSYPGEVLTVIAKWDGGWRGHAVRDADSGRSPHDRVDDVHVPAGSRPTPDDLRTARGGDHRSRHPVLGAGHGRSVRVALPHRRPRGQRDDAAGAGAAGRHLATRPG